MNERIVLIGPMGAGKSEVGAELARRLGRPFIDTDRLVEERAGVSIATIFEREGEPSFRILESAAVAEAVLVDGAVISCGGGAVTSESNVELLRKAGRVVYLKVDAATAADRLDGHTSRPLLKGTDTKYRLTELIAAREPIYEATADHVVESAGGTEEVVLRVLKVLEE